MVGRPARDRPGSTERNRTAGEDVVDAPKRPPRLEGSTTDASGGQAGPVKGGQAPRAGIQVAEDDGPERIRPHEPRQLLDLQGVGPGIDGQVGAHDVKAPPSSDYRPARLFFPNPRELHVVGLLETLARQSDPVLPVAAQDGRKELHFQTREPRDLAGLIDVPRPGMEPVELLERDELGLGPSDRRDRAFQVDPIVQTAAVTDVERGDDGFRHETQDSERRMRALAP